MNPIPNLVHALGISAADRIARVERKLRDKRSSYGGNCEGPTRSLSRSNMALICDAEIERQDDFSEVRDCKARTYAVCVSAWFGPADELRKMTARETA